MKVQEVACAGDQEGFDVLVCRFYGTIDSLAKVAIPFDEAMRLLLFERHIFL